MNKFGSPGPNHPSPNLFFLEQSEALPHGRPSENKHPRRELAPFGRVTVTADDRRIYFECQTGIIKKPV